MRVEKFLEKHYETVNVGEIKNDNGEITHLALKILFLFDNSDKKQVKLYNKLLKIIKNSGVEEK